MSGVFGIFNRNGNPVDKKIADDMLNSMSSWNPDESNLWSNGPVTLGHAMLWNTPESKFEHLPLEKEAYILTMDARIDNRDELLKELELPDRPMSEIGDSEFILAAYEKWGEECPKHLLGDFAFVIWDEKIQQLFCVRDHIGIKLFHFYLSDELFVFSNDIEAILAHNKVSRTLDNQIVATFLKDEGIHTRRRTFFDKIKKLPPASTLVVTRSSVIEKKYWKIEKVPSIQYKTYEEYVVRLKILLENAVEVRLRTDFPVVSHLSGGIDSSPIAVVAARKLRKINQNLHAFNWINIPQGDEYEYEAWSFSRRIAVQENIIHKEFRIDPQFIADQYEAHNFLTRGTMYYWEEYVVQDMVENIGARSILSGWGGDELVSHRGSSYLADRLENKKYFDALKHVFYEKKYLKQTWIQVFKQMIKIVIPSNVINYLAKWRRKVHSLEMPINTECTTKEFSKFMNTHKYKQYKFVPDVRKQQLVLFHYGHLQDRIESWGLSAFPKRIEYKYPLLDKRIVEFAMGIPTEMYYPKKGLGRHLMQNTVAELLPSDIAWFPKPNETKINEQNRKRYIATLKIIQKKYINRNDTFENKYVNYKQIQEILKTFELEKYNPYNLDSVVVAIQLIHSIKKIEKL